MDFLRAAKDDISYKNQKEWKEIQEFLPPHLRLLADSSCQLPEEQVVDMTVNQFTHQVHLDCYRNPSAPAKLILFHGVGTNGRQMTLLLGAPIAQKGYETIAIDMPEYGVTKVAKGALVLYDDWVEIGHQIINKELERDSRPIFLYGLSAGGMLTYHVAAKNRKVKGIIGMTFLDQRQQQVRDETSYNSFISRYGIPSAQIAVKTMLSRMRLPMKALSKMHLLVNNPHALQVWLQDSSSAAKWVTLAFINSYMNYQPEMEPEDFDVCNVLLTQPGQDQWTPLHLSEPFLKRITKVDVQINVLENAGHYPLEQVGILQMHVVINNFLKQHIDGNNGVEISYNSWDPLTVIGENGRHGTSPLIIRSVNDTVNPLIIRSVNDTVGINDFLSNILADIQKALTKPSRSGTKRNHPKRPKVVERWDDFKTEAARYEYPTTPIGADVVLPPTTEIKFKLERDVDKVIGNHLDNFNRIFRDQGKACRFESKADVFPSAPETESQENHLNFIGVPDNVLTLGSKVLSFVEDKTPNDLPVRHHQNGDLFDLLEIYKEDIQYKPTGRTRGDIGRTDVRTVIDQVYGYLSLNNLIYGCVTCYDVTYFLWRPRRGTLLISHPIFNRSRYPSLLQALYYFIHLVLQGHDNEQQSLDPSPKDSDLPVETTSYEEMDTDQHCTQGHSDSGSNYSSLRDSKNKRAKYDLNLDSLRSGTVVGFGATGQVIRLKDSNIVVKHCDSYNNPDGFKMLMNEILVYEKLSKLNLEYVPRYYGECELYGQYFIALDFISGKHCDWRTNSELNDKLDFVIRDLKSFGVVHQDLRPENVLLTREGDIKLIDFGKADIQ